MLKGQVREVIKGLDDGINSATRGISDMTEKLTESTTRYKNALAWPVSQGQDAGPPSSS